MSWLEKEENSQLCDVLFRILLRQDDLSFDPSMGRSDFEEKGVVPDIASLSNLVKLCIQESKPLPQDYKSLLYEDLFRALNVVFPQPNSDRGDGRNTFYQVTAYRPRNDHRGTTNNTPGSTRRVQQ